MTDEEIQALIAEATTPKKVEPPAPTVLQLPAPLAVSQLFDTSGAFPGGNSGGYTQGMVRSWLGDQAFERIPQCDGRPSEGPDAEAMRLLLGGDGATPQLTGRVVVGASDAALRGTVDAVRNSVSMRYLIAIEGLSPQGTTGHIQGETYLSTVLPYAGEIVPRGWLPAEGQLLPIQEHMHLFSHLGTLYGGDGMVDFALPDLRGRVPVGTGKFEDGTEIRIGERIDDAAGGVPALGMAMYVIHSGSYLAPDAGMAGEPFVGEVVTLAGQVQFENAIALKGGAYRGSGLGMLAMTIGNRFGGTGDLLGIPDLTGRALAGAEVRANSGPARVGGFGLDLQPG